MLLALAIEPADEGCEAFRYQEGEDGPLVQALVGAGVRVWAGPREPGDLQRRLGQLRELAEFCVERGMLVAWA